MISIIANDISVDAGLILISDDTFYEKYNGSIREDCCKIVEIENGKYSLDWNIDDTYAGDISGENEIIEITSGRIIISDPCYHFDNENWDKILDDYDFLSITPEGCFIIDEMGGDGTYKVELRLRKING